jgi:predicted GIY-YIG superfamily endonuclease
VPHFGDGAHVVRVVGRAGRVVCAVGDAMTTFVYRLYNASDELLYIGMSGRLMARIETHTQTQPWRDQIAYVKADGFPNRKAASRAEREAIRIENPKYNVLHKTPEALMLDKLQQFWETLDDREKSEALAASKTIKDEIAGPHAQHIRQLHAALFALFNQSQGLQSPHLTALVGES